MALGKVQQLNETPFLSFFLSFFSAKMSNNKALTHIEFLFYIGHVFTCINSFEFHNIPVEYYHYFTLWMRILKFREVK